MDEISEKKFVELLRITDQTNYQELPNYQDLVIGSSAKSTLILIKVKTHLVFYG